MDSSTSDPKKEAHWHYRITKIDPGEVCRGNVGEMVVIPVGETLEAENVFGKIRVTALSPIRRRIVFQWNEQSELTFDLTLDKRNAPFFGYTGIYTGQNYGPFPPKIVYQEGQKFVRTRRDAEIVLKEEPSFDFAVNSKGLAVGLFDSKYGDVPNIKIMQLMIDQKIPTDFMQSGRVRTSKNF